jgi:transposase
VLDGPINGVSFLAYVNQFLVPTLHARDVVVIDNVGSRNAGPVRQAPYRPDLNPIEQVSTKLKTLLRTAEPRSIDYLRNAGYAST